MKDNLLLLTFFSLMLTGCIGGEDTSNKIQSAAQAKAQQQSYDIQLTGDWIKDAKVVDSHNQRAVYKGKGLYSFRNQPQGTITLTGGTFENTGVANKMVMRADANSKTLSPLNSFLYENPHLKNQVLNALNNEGSNNQNAQFKTSKIVYLMASNNLLNRFSSSLNNVQNYNDIVVVARNASVGSTNAESINTALMLMGLSFFDVSNKSHISKITTGDVTMPTVKSVTPNDGKIGASTNRPSFTITFSKKVLNVTPDNLSLVKKGTSTNLIAAINKVSGSNYTVTPNIDLTLDTDYVLTIKSGIKDEAGNAIAQVIKNYTTYAQKRYITENGGASVKDGKSWATAYEGAKLQQAIDDVETKKGEVWIAKGVYKPGTSESDFFELKDGVKLYGGFVGNETSLIDRDNASSHKTVFSGDIDNNDARRTADGITNSYRDIVGRNSENIIKLKDATDDNTLIDRVYITGGASDIKEKAGGLTLKDAKVTLKDIYFFGNKNTDAPGSLMATGGAIRAEGSTLIIDGATFKRNYARYGGAIAHTDSSLDINHAQFDNNWAGSGGAISSKDANTASIRNTSFTNNHANKSGGALYNTSSNHTITNVAFINNFATNSGGAIYNSASSNTLNKITFYGNRVQRDDSATVGSGGSSLTPGMGGAIYNRSGSNSTITNATFAYNTNFSGNTDATITRGGAIYNLNSAPKLINSTFVHNRALATGGGGAMYTADNSSSTGKPMFVNSILWHNHHPNDNNRVQYDDKHNFSSTDSQAMESHSHIDTAVGATPAIPSFKKIKQTKEGVEHIYYQLKTPLTGALASGSQTVGSATVRIPNKDQVDTPRGSSVNKGAIQAVDASIAGATFQPFIEYIAVDSQNSSASTKALKIKFSEAMNSASITHATTSSSAPATIVVKDEDGATPSNLAVTQLSSNISKVSFEVTSGKWYSLSIKKGIKKSGSTANCLTTPSLEGCLNREYIYEFKTN